LHEYACSGARRPGRIRATWPPDLSAPFLNSLLGRSDAAGGGRTARAFGEPGRPTATTEPMYGRHRPDHLALIGLVGPFALQPAGPTTHSQLDGPGSHAGSHGGSELAPRPTVTEPVCATLCPIIGLKWREVLSEG